MKKSDLEGNIKEKFLFVGSTSVGKTRICSLITKIYIMNGKKVMYIDSEHGTDREFKNIFSDMSDEELERIELVHATDIEIYLKSMLGWTEEKTLGTTQVIKVNHGLDYDLKICDGLMSEIELYKTKLTQRFIKQGYYTIGEKQFPISNPDTFVLPYQFYNKLYEQIREAIVIMMGHKYDIIATTHPFKATESQQALEQSIFAKFDSVVRMNKIVLSNGFPKWNGTVIKNRGRESPDKSNVMDNVDVLLSYFIKKFGMPLEDTLKRLLMIKEEVKK